MAVKASYVVLASGRAISFVLDILLNVWLFTLAESYNQPVGAGIAAALFGLITDLYDLLAFFDPTGKTEQTPMVALGDGISDIIGIAALVQLSITYHPPADAPWLGTYHNAFDLLIFFIIFHAILGIARTASFVLDARARKADLVAKESQRGTPLEIVTSDAEP